MYIRLLIVTFLFFATNSASTQSKISVCSWNLENFGKSKSDSVINFIANTVRDCDVVAMQEVVAGDGGAHAVSRLNDVLNRMGFNWDYAISDPTISSSNNVVERYAFIWKTSKLTIVGKALLEKKYNLKIEREPFLATFKNKGKLFTMVSFHAIPKSKQPETEIKYLKFLPKEYPDKNLIFCGDFNCPQSHTVFNPLKSMGYKPTLIHQKTSLRQKCINDDCLASEYDNFFFNSSKISFIKSGVILFYKSFQTLKVARTVSDHVPIYFQFSLN